ncbi:MAG: YqgE/AlgH family protein [Pseudomonadota bacterium]|nr:YqgE/AlgH family protein [Pseudomonadota bacterium]
MNDNWMSLKGQFLLATPGMDDPYFEHAVIYMISHTQTEGALGIIINRPAEKVSLADVLGQLNLPHADAQLPPLILGGPSKVTNGFILHSDDYQTLSTRLIADDIYLTATQDILRDITLNKGPKEFLIALGCASWTRGQLEDELSGNIWLTAPATHQILFHTPFEDRWHTTLKSIGIDSYRLSAVSGKA